MPVEFIGYVGTQEVSEIIPPSGPVIDPAYTRTVALAHEAGGFDRVLMAHSSASPDAVVTAAQVFADTSRLGVLLAHRPGFVAPTLAARTFATLDQFSKGRLAVHIISGGDDADQRRDGDYLDHDQRYARTAEYLDIIKRIWGSDKPIDHEGILCRQTLAETAFADLLRRILGGGHQGRSSICRCLCLVGRVARAGRRHHRAGAKRRGAIWTRRTHSIQLELETDPGTQRN